MEDGQAGAVDQELALELGLGVHELYQHAGQGWTRLATQDMDQEWDPVRWYVSGEPPQVMLGVTGPGESILVARPRGVWRSQMFTVEPDSPHHVAERPTDLPVLLAQVAVSRRRSFRWCRYCRNLTPPEHRTEADVCSGCAAVVLGVVF